MTRNKHFGLTSLMLLLVCWACVESIDFDVPDPSLQVVVEGMVSDQPGPYKVRLSEAVNVNADSAYYPPIEGAAIRLFESGGLEELFVEVEPGIYETGGVIQGRVGKAYHIEITLKDGVVIESEPEVIKPVGTVEDIRYEYERREGNDPLEPVEDDVFNIYVDAEAGGQESENLVRWRLTGTYKVLTYPELKMTETPPYTPYKDPPPCSGYIVIGFVPGGKLSKVGECTCCTCYVNDYYDIPKISTDRLVVDGQFQNVKIGEVPINSSTFHEKYMLKVEQMSLSSTAYDFFSKVKNQKVNSSSIFQPIFGEINGNLISNDPSRKVIGLFYATAIDTRVEFIDRSEVPFNLTPIGVITQACYNVYPNASTTQPAEWQ